MDAVQLAFKIELRPWCVENMFYYLCQDGSYPITCSKQKGPPVIKQSPNRGYENDRPTLAKISKIWGYKVSRAAIPAIYSKVDGFATVKELN